MRREGQAFLNRKSRACVACPAFVLQLLQNLQVVQNSQNDTDQVVQTDNAADEPANDGSEDRDQADE